MAIIKLETNFVPGTSFDGRKSKQFISLHRIKHISWEELRVGGEEVNVYIINGGREVRTSQQTTESK
jgi:hypothetical protein